MKNIAIVILALIICASIGASVYSMSSGGSSGSGDVNENVTLVTTPDQEGFEEHPEWTLPDVVIDDNLGTNIAINKSVKESGHNDVYACKNVNDGSDQTYWEGKAREFPNSVTIDLESAQSFDKVRILLNPKSIWGPRTQEVDIEVSSDGENFTNVYPKTELSFAPATGNFALMELETPAEGQYVRLNFYSNSGATAGQAAEIEIYAAE